MKSVNPRDRREKHIRCQHCGAESRPGYGASRGQCPEHPAAGQTTVQSKHEWVEVEEGSA